MCQFFCHVGNVQLIFSLTKIDGLPVFIVELFSIFMSTIETRELGLGGPIKFDGSRSPVEAKATLKNLYRVGDNQLEKNKNLYLPI